MSAVSGLGKLVRDRRIALGKTGRDFAHELDIEPSMLSRLETGTMKTFPEPEMIGRLADLLETQPVELLIAAGYITEADLTTDDTPVVRELTGLLRRIAWTPDRLRFVRTALLDLAAHTPTGGGSRIPSDLSEG